MLKICFFGRASCCTGSCNIFSKKFEALFVHVFLMFFLIFVCVFFWREEDFSLKLCFFFFDFLLIFLNFLKRKMFLFLI